MNALSSTFKLPSKYLILKVYIALLLTSSVAFAAEEKQSCAIQYMHLVRDSVRNAPAAFTRWQKNYWSEVRQNPTRLLFAPREQRERFQFLGFLQDPIAESFGLKKRMSIPLSMVLWWQFIDKPFANYIDESYTEKISQSEDKALGARYALEMLQLGVMPAKEMAKLLDSHHQEINRWLAAKDTDLVSLPRLKALLDAGVLRSPEEAVAFNRLAKRVFREVRALEPETKQDTQFAQKVFSQLTLELQKDSWKHLREKNRFLLSTVYLPEMKIKERSDLDWLLEENSSIDRLAPTLGIPLTIVTKAMWKQASAEEKLQRKQRVEKILPKKKWDLAERVDLPFLTEPLDGMQNELDYWQRIMSDIRYRKWKDLWLADRLTDIEALKLFRTQVRDEQMIHSFHRSLQQNQRGPNSGELCSLMGYKGEGNSLFLTVRNFADSLQSGGILNDEQWLVCRMKLAQKNWEFYTGQKISTALPLGIAPNTDQLLADFVEKECFQEVNEESLAASLCK